MKKIYNFTNEYELYLRDESRKIGYADSISFPKTVEEASEIVKYCSERGICITVQGSRTGVGCGAVPYGGHIMSLERLKKLHLGNNGNSVIAGAGCSLKEINEFIRLKTKNKYFFPPDPTENTASAGGMIACNSSGARTYRYGSVRGYVKRLQLVMSDGEIFNIERGRFFAKGRNAILSIYSSTTGGDGVAITGAEDRPPDKIININLPEYHMPESKNAAGYYIYDDMDLIDLFIGSEGTLGIITEVELEIIKKPEIIWGVITYFRDSDRGIDFSECLKSVKDIDESPFNSFNENIMSIEFFDEGSLRLLKNKGWGISEDYKEAVFTELKADSQEEMIENIRMLEKFVIESGGSSDDVRIAGRRNFEHFKEMRHATPEAVNEKIAEIKKKCPAITKLGSDMSVPEKSFKRVVEMYKNDMKEFGLDYVIFGHAGNSHLHVNIISRSEDELIKGKEIFSDWADKVGRLGGSVSAEHGVGKLKREFLLKMYGKEAVEEMLMLKKTLDPIGILGRDNIFIWNKYKK